MSNIILSAQSSSNEVKEYFNSVLTLTKSGENFPVDLDDVWPLCYNQKIGAIRLLTDSGQFYEGEDYILLCQKAKQTEVGSGGHNRQVYMLSVPCMEYLIARKVRTVFEVYRLVFHEFLNMKRMTSDEAIAYGYGKALEKINRQSTIIARQSKQLQKYKSQLEVEKEKKEQKRIVFAQTLTDDVKDWILTIGVTGVIKLSTLHQKYHEWFTDNGRNYITIRQLAAQLRILGYASIHKRNGTWFII